MSDQSASESPVLFVGQLPFTATQQDLYDLFSQYGEVVGVRMARKSMRREGKFVHLFTGVAHVEYDSAATAAAALPQLQGLSYKGRTLRADGAAQRTGASAAAPRPPTSQPSDTLYVANLPYKFDVGMVQAVFKTSPGYVKVRDTEEGVAKGWVYVQYESVEAAMAAVKQFNGQFFQSRPMRLDYANTTNTTVVKSKAGKDAVVPEKKTKEKKTKDEIKSEESAAAVPESKKEKKNKKQAKRSAFEANVDEDNTEVADQPKAKKQKTKKVKSEE